MTEAGWTREKPTKNGWYWWREGPGEKHKMVRITKGYKALRVEVPLHNSWMFGAVDGFGGEFKGPIAPDSYQQGRVAGLGDVKRYVERQIKIGEDFIGGPDPNIQRRVALNEVIEYCDRQLAQAAQKEKGVGDDKV